MSEENDPNVMEVTICRHRNRLQPTLETYQESFRCDNRGALELLLADIMMIAAEENTDLDVLSGAARLIHERRMSTLPSNWRDEIVKAAQYKFHLIEVPGGKCTVGESNSGNEREMIKLGLGKLPGYEFHEFDTKEQRQAFIEREKLEVTEE